MIEFRGEKYITVKEYLENNKLKNNTVIYNSVFNPIKYVSIDEKNIVTFRYTGKIIKYTRDWEDVFVKVK